jgi:hypothetical protein
MSANEVPGTDQRCASNGADIIREVADQNSRTVAHYQLPGYAISLAEGPTVSAA